MRGVKLPTYQPNLHKAANNSASLLSRSPRKFTVCFDNLPGEFASPARTFQAKSEPFSRDRQTAFQKGRRGHRGLSRFPASFHQPMRLSRGPNLPQRLLWREIHRIHFITRYGHSIWLPIHGQEILLSNNRWEIAITGAELA